MSDAHELYRDTVRALYAATGSGDWATAETYLTDDFFITEAPQTPMAGLYSGRNALQDLYRKVFGMLDVVGLDLQDITAGTDHAVVILDMLLAGTPPVRVKLAEMFRFRDGKICEIRPYYFDPAPLADAVRPD